MLVIKKIEMLVGGRRAYRRLQGALLGLGAPLGWLLIRMSSGHEPLAEVLQNLSLYSYMLFGTVLVFTAFGDYSGNQEQKLESLSFTDQLTGLFNRRFFRMRLTEEIIHTERNKQPLSLISFDLDHFKNINDQYGHNAGDNVLKSIGKMAHEVLREAEVVGRVGGEEFAILLPSTTTEVAAKIAERLREKIKAIRIPVGVDIAIGVTASFGVATTTGSMDEDDLIVKADQALYKAKDNGRNQVQVAV